MTEIFVSTDVETDGPIPGRNSLLSFGSAAFRSDGTMIGTHTANLTTLPGAGADPDTMAWWARNPEAWQNCRSDPRDPGEAMSDYRGWLEALPGKPVFVGYPAAFDFMFVYWYLVRFTGGSPFSHSALDLKSYAMAVLGSDFRATTKRTMPRDWFGPSRHTHVALDDAIEQGHLWLAMRRAAGSRSAQ
ncbi:exonuclease [Actinoplanes sp. NPDC049596]|uniref:exonuclease n=1 Tax=unclassified Actinoplanes TaxID=2626549 RepID=UPI003444B92A